MGEQRAGIGRYALALGLAATLSLSPLGDPARAQDASGSGHEIRLAQGASKKKAAKSKKGKAEADSAAKPDKSASADDAAPKFSRDVAPVLVGNCIGCHSPASANTRAHVLDLSTFKGLMAGAKTRKVIEPSKPDDSPLILRIRGDEMPRMPPTANVTIADTTIQKIAAWIAAGAKLDPGKDPAALIASYAMTADAARLEGLSKLDANGRDRRVVDAGLERWKKVVPATPPEFLIGSRVILFHNLPKPRAEALKKQMDAQATALRKFLAVGPTHPLEGPLKVSLYVFNESNNFVELARTLESREMDEGNLASANFADPVPYVAAADPQGGREEAPVGKKEKGGKASSKGFGTADRNLGALLTEQLAAAAVAPLATSKAPRWLRSGFGAWYASRIEPRNAYYRQLRASALEQYQANWAEQAKLVLTDGTDAEKLRAAGFSMIEWIFDNDREKLPAFVQGMSEGGDKLDAGLIDLWGMKRDDFLAVWGAWIAEKYGQ